MRMPGHPAQRVSVDELESRQGIQDLDLSHGDHLLSQMVLVCSDRSIPASDRLVLADHDVLGNFIKQSIQHVSLSMRK